MKVPSENTRTEPPPATRSTSANVTGTIPIYGIYATYAPEQIAYILDNAAGRAVTVENAKQVAAVRGTPIKLTSLDVAPGQPLPACIAFDELRVNVRTRSDALPE